MITEIPSKKEDLVTRIEMINSSNADLFISIHTNSFTNPKSRFIIIL